MAKEPSTAARSRVQALGIVLVAVAATTALAGSAAGSAARRTKPVVVRPRAALTPGGLAGLEAYVPAQWSCALTLQHGSRTLRSKLRVAPRADVEFSWRVPVDAASGRWRVTVGCARRGKVASAVRRSAPATLTVARRAGAPGGQGPIARARAIRMVAMAPGARLATTAAAAWPPRGVVLVPGSAWRVPGAAGRACSRTIKWPCGVNVYSNNWSGWPYSPPEDHGEFGSYKWQCVELIERFVNEVGWYSGLMLAPDGTAASMYEAAPSAFVKHRNGSGYRPVPGDIVIYAGDRFGHIAIVESDDGTHVVVLEQNVRYELGRGKEVFAGKTLLAQRGWTGFSVIGFLHARLNTGAVAPSNGLLAIGVCGAAGEGVPPSPGGICTLRPDGSRLRQITKGVDSEPAWSPDRGKIAFVRLNSQGARHIYVVNADGSGIRSLTNGTNDRGPAWSPKGRKIAFSRNGRIGVLDVATGNVTVFTAGPRDYDPSWSADGSLLAFDSGTAPAEVDVMTSTGGHRRTLVIGVQPAWAPSGTALAFVRITVSGSHIALTNGITGTPVHYLTTGQTDDSYTPAWSPDAKRLAFGRGQDMENPGVWVMNADGSHQTLLFGGYDPAW